MKIIELLLIRKTWDGWFIGKVGGDGGFYEIGGDPNNVGWFWNGVIVIFSCQVLKYFTNLVHNVKNVLTFYKKVSSVYFFIFAVKRRTLWLLLFIKFVPSNKVGNATGLLPTKILILELCKFKDWLPIALF